MNLCESASSLKHLLYRVCETQRECLSKIRGPVPSAAEDSNCKSGDDLESILFEVHALASQVDSHASEISQKIGGSDALT